MKEKKRKRIVGACVAVLVGLLVAGLIFALTYKKETRTSSDNTVIAGDVLVCESESPLDPFFVSAVAKSVSHKIKVTYASGVIDKMNYTYSGKFEDEKTTESALSILHADYNTYVGKAGDPEDLYPTFSTMGEDGLINLYFEDKTLNSTTAKLVFLNGGDFAKLKRLSIDELAKIYNEKGFSCQITK